MNGLAFAVTLAIALGCGLAAGGSLYILGTAGVTIAAFAAAVALTIALES